MGTPTKFTKANPPPRATALTTFQLYCSRCHASVVACYHCSIDFSNTQSIFCDDGRHVHEDCLENYLKDQPD